MKCVFHIIADVRATLKQTKKTYLFKDIKCKDHIMRYAHGNITLNYFRMKKKKQFPLCQTKYVVWLGDNRAQYLHSCLQSSSMSVVGTEHIYLHTHTQ